MMDIIVATRNAHKVAEIQGMLAGMARIRSQIDFPSAPPAVEDAGTFAGNAIKKAQSLAQWIVDTTGERPCVLADDSGLEVDALGGAPGVHSARFAADDAGGTANSPDADNNAKLLRLLQSIMPDKRTARFRCVLALTTKDGGTLSFEGHCEGRIAGVPSGASGFGYDPLFIPDGFAQSFAELGSDVKNKISHRARALTELRKYLDQGQA